MPSLIQLSPKGLYCAQADIYIDPWRPVSKALITHAHSDHARPGHGAYLCHTDSVGLLQHRIAHNIKVQGTEYGKRLTINGVEISFHPAGHIIGSAQIRVSNSSEVWVVSGDYKLGKDPLLTEFEPVKCDYFVTESTFGLPVFQWKNDDEVFEEMNHWWSQNRRLNKASIISAYSLGKAQRVIQGIDHSIGPVLTHGAVDAINEVLRQNGFKLKPSKPLTQATADEIKEALIVCPPGAMDSSWTKQIKNHASAFASGWMALRGARRRRSIEKGFILSDHADWRGLNRAVKMTGAGKVYVTHGYSDVFSRWLNEQGIEAQSMKTMYSGESIDNEKEESL